MNFGIEFGMSLLVFGILAKWYAWPYLRSRSFTRALLIPFLVCYLGLMSLVPGIVDPAVTHSSFALYQAWGDFIAFLLALAAFVLPEASPRSSCGRVTYSDHWSFSIL
jgi:hypothetical protein